MVLQKQQSGGEVMEQNNGSAGHPAKTDARRRRGRGLPRRIHPGGELNARAFEDTALRLRAGVRWRPNQVQRLLRAVGEELEAPKK